MVPEGGSIVNAMKVAPAQQVMLKVRFLEVARSASREIGVNLVWGKQHDSGLSLIWTIDGTSITGSAKAGFQPNVVKEAQESSLIVDRGCGRVGCEQFCSDSGRTRA
jgi:Flp pilus assembly secretin CpaC